MEASENTSELIKQLDEDVEDLEDALAPLLTSALSETASKLPLLDRAKLYVLATYAIESIIFSFLRLNGANAKEHPVFKELARVKQYFEKIKTAENIEQGPNLRVDKAAAGRIIKHALAHREVREDAAGTSDQPKSVFEQKTQATSNKRKLDEVETVKHEDWRARRTEPDSDSSSSVSSDASPDSSEAEVEARNSLIVGQTASEPKNGEASKDTNDPGVHGVQYRHNNARKAQGQNGGQGKPPGSLAPSASKKKKRKNKNKGLKKG